MFLRLFSRIYWFYKDIIKEKDPFMQYWYTAFAISMLVVFVLNFLSAILYAATSSELFAFGYQKFLISYGLVIIILMVIFFKKREDLQRRALAFKEKFGPQDVFIMILIVFALSCSFLAPIIYKSLG